MQLIRSLSLIIVVLVSFSFAQTAYAARGSYWDLRLSLGTYPGANNVKDHYDYTYSSDTNNYSMDSSGGDLEFVVSHRFYSSSDHSGYIDFGGFYRISSGDMNNRYGVMVGDRSYSVDVDVDINMEGTSVGGGYSFWPLAWYSLEVGPRLGLGIATAEVKNLWDKKVKSDPGFYVSYELAVRNIFNVTKNFQLGVGLGWAGWSTLTKIEYTTRNNDKESDDLTFTGSNVFLNGFGGFRF